MWAVSIAPRKVPSEWKGFMMSTDWEQLNEIWDDQPAVTKKILYYIMTTNGIDTQISELTTFITETLKKESFKKKMNAL